jgi:hypothetical protein
MLIAGGGVECLQRVGSKERNERFIHLDLLHPGFRVPVCRVTLLLTTVQDTFLTGCSPVEQMTKAV